MSDHVYLLVEQGSNGLKPGTIRIYSGVEALGKAVLKKYEEYTKEEHPRVKSQFDNWFLKWEFGHRIYKRKVDDHCDSGRAIKLEKMLVLFRECESLKKEFLKAELRS